MNSTINNHPSTASPHEKLDAWLVTKSLAKHVYEITAGFPRAERFCLVDQMRRVGISVMSNLAEGCGQTSARDQAHFSQMAFGSLLELDAQLQLALDLSFLTERDYQEIRQPILELVKRISALRSSQLTGMANMQPRMMKPAMPVSLSPALPMNLPPPLHAQRAGEGWGRGCANVYSTHAPHPNLPPHAEEGVKATLSLASSQLVAIPRFMGLNSGEKIGDCGLSRKRARGTRTRCASFTLKCAEQ